MKNKKMTYVLGAAVLILWALIIRMVIIWANGNGNDTVLVSSSKVVKEPYNDYTVLKDTTHLLLNYRDPFGMVKFKDTVQAPIKSSHHKAASLKPKPFLNWTFVTYSGYIHNSASKKLIALVSIHGKNVMLSEGDMKEQVKLIKNMRDSIKISYNGQTKFIAIKSLAL